MKVKPFLPVQRLDLSDRPRSSYNPKQLTTDTDAILCSDPRFPPTFCYRRSRRRKAALEAGRSHDEPEASEDRRLAAGVLQPAQPVPHRIQR